MRRRPGPLAAAMLAAGTALLAGVGAARAADCTALPSPVYVAGSTAAKPLLAEIGRIMAGATPPATVVYMGQGSCAGVDAILSGTPLRGTGNTFSIWDGSGTELHCDVAEPGVQADVGLSDVFASTCFDLPGGLQSNVADFLGPVQTMTFVVPKSSPEQAISADAAYDVFGFGKDSGVAPWTDDTAILRRDALSGTQRMIAAAIGVPPDRWAGTATTSSGDLLTRLAATGTAGLGILSADVAQDSRATVSVLAYQHSGQTCAVYPDSDANANDKSNVRNGHYAIWGPLHLLARITPNGYPVRALADTVIGYITGTRVSPPGLDLIAVEARRHVIPQCAMRVRRAQELGPLSSFAPTGACGCYYERLANGFTSCKRCNTASDCTAGGTPVCSYGYCETQ